MGCVLDLTLCSSLPSPASLASLPSLLHPYTSPTHAKHGCQGRLGDAVFDAAVSMLAPVPRLSPSPSLRPLTGGAVCAVLDRDALGSAAAVFVTSALLKAFPHSSGGDVALPRLFGLHLRALPGQLCV